MSLRLSYISCPKEEIEGQNFPQLVMRIPASCKRVKKVFSRLYSYLNVYGLRNMCTSSCHLTKPLDALTELEVKPLTEQTF